MRENKDQSVNTEKHKEHGEKRAWNVTEMTGWAQLPRGTQKGEEEQLLGELREHWGNREHR